MDVNSFTILEVCHKTGLSEDQLHHYIEHEWIVPHSADLPSLDHEDLARLHLIVELKNDLGIPDEAIPVILRLVDQIHALRNEISRKMSALSEL